ncbi:MAG: hypothetical protein ACRDN9_02065 [Streptosporangiaceae bacterium]
MNPSKVLLVTLVGPSGQVDVAVRVDLPAVELLPAFMELVGDRLMSLLIMSPSRSSASTGCT